MPPNFTNRTVWTGDNLDVMRGMNSGCVDLIYLDPPFNSGKQWSAPIGSEAAGAAFKDTWSLSDVNLVEHGAIKEKNAALGAVIDAAGLAHGKPMQSYLIYMGIRMIEMKRLLKPTASIYLHCDDTAGAWLRTMMDAVFGDDCYRNTINWKRTSSRSDAKRFGRVTDNILYYSHKDATWNGAWVPLDQEYVRKFYRHRDQRGPYRHDNLTGAGLRDGDSGRAWRGRNPSDAGRHWAVPGRYAEWIESIIPGYRAIKGAHDRLDALDDAGMIAWPRGGDGMPALKRYLTASRGVAASDMITDIPPIAAQAKERTGYPTQKPLKLLQRIIEASSNEGDMVLDPFCGCATACVAAEKLDRQWAGIDVSPLAYSLVQQRLAREVSVGSAETPRLTGWNVTHREDVPQRTDLGDVPPYNSPENRERLYGRQGGDCNGCEVHFLPRNLTVDHIVPQSRGGSHHIDNLQLLCGACNSTKGTGSQAELIAKLRETGVRE